MYQGECPIANKHLMTVIYLNLIFLAYRVEQKVPKAAIFMLYLWQGGKGMLKQLNDIINYAEFMNIRQVLQNPDVF